MSHHVRRDSLAISVPRLVVGGVASGVGKTTFVVGLVGALVRRGLRVAPFKVGPDYIDPSHHARVAGRPCRNLDSWMVPPPALRELFARATDGADVAVVEGVMGLYDGRDATSDAGSTAEVAKLLDAPTVLIIDAAKSARSVGAVALGFRAFDPDLDLAGVVFNGVGGPTHRKWLDEAVERRAGLAVYGHLPRRPELALPERHLGLVPTDESAPANGLVEKLIDQVEATLDVDALLALARRAAPLAVEPTGLFPDAPVPPRVRIGVALDRAFNFYYQDNLDLLAAWGAEIAPISPLDDPALPAGLDGLYLGGGFPELFAAELAANASFLESVRGFVAAGRPVYAECGGLMYLGRGIRDFEGCFHELVGAGPGASAMTRERLTLGYRTATARRDSPLLRRGESVRGHEFHWSELVQPPDSASAAYDFAEVSGKPEGHAAGNLLASYLHVHFASRPDLAPRLVASAAQPVC